MKHTWGEHITMLVAVDFNYIPGVYGLFNSALENGFKGKLLILTSDNITSSDIVQHPQLGILKYERLQGNYSFSTHRINALPQLLDGDYLFIDADFIVERPSEILFEALEDGLILSSEPEPKYDFNDTIIYRMAKKMNVNTLFRPTPYFNAGLVTFRFPRDRQFIEDWVNHSKNILNGITTIGTSPDAFFVEQDVLNTLIKSSNYPYFSISPRLLELNSSPPHFYHRRFPYTLQSDLHPIDQRKYLIHGGAARRPWLPVKGSGLLRKIKNFLEYVGIKGMYKKPSPYERAWAYYTCREDAPIPLSAWATKYNFSSYKNFLWRKAHNIK